MEFKNMNILNFFNKREVNNKSIALLVLAFLPAIFVTKTIEAMLVYVLMFLVYLIISTFTSKLINKVVPSDAIWVVSIIVFVGLATLMNIFTKAFFVAFHSEYGLYIYLFAINVLPIMLMEDNSENSIGKGLVDTIKSFIGFFVIMLTVAIVREVLGSGMIVFGAYTNISFNVDLFSTHAFSILSNPYGALIILGLFVALLKNAANKKGEAL